MDTLDSGGYPAPYKAAILRVVPLIKRPEREADATIMPQLRMCRAPRPSMYSWRGTEEQTPLFSLLRYLHIFGTAQMS